MENYVRTGVIGAMDAEVEKITRALTGVKAEEVGGSTFYRGKLNGIEVIVVQSGIGKVNAAFAATVLAVKYGVREILMTGVAGGIGGGLKPLDAFVPSAIIQHDVDVLGCEKGYLDIVNCIEITTDESLSERLRVSSNGKSGIMATGEQFISLDGQKSKILHDFPKVQAVDMETGAVAQVCMRMGVPFACIKFISDDGSAQNFSAFKIAASDLATKAVLATL